MPIFALTALKWARANIIPAIAIVIGLALAIILAWNLWQSSVTAKTKVKLATGQANAQIESGRDAVETVGNRAESDAQSDTLTRSNGDEIRNAEGASAPVAPPVRDAGLASLCRRSAYRGDARCLLKPTP